MSNITVIGAGNIGSAVAGIALKSGASVQVIDRDAQKASAVSGATATTYGEPVTGDIVVLALPYPAYADVLSTYSTQLAGKTVVDVSNPIDFSSFDLALPAGAGSAAEELAAKLPDSTIVKAFNTTFAATLASGENDGAPTTVLVASDDDAAKKAVSDFIQGGGLRALDAGPLKRASYLEGIGALQIFLGVTEQTPWTGGFKIVK
ncbi:NADP oxidoreductase coenzyme F420-dependent [Bifidobacterium minimum]|jgi:predicted dinucleotide-binding enzyme|uniref:NADP oxidoreductase coenzyme F420-dependent n=1 Tax=Bifidobacterium minimum TaxID=1693 RepID=A0A087BPP9_9BIFI|nr:NADPH-dependent F420 reductase [Bifidobacterium minimum]KFI72999.1 NADP oxidoreductase coenzyme F420-dependent [Bifidobacterium minimum]MCH4159309.1 NADPH-dependent F420 reductase [Bifidobacterium minimum]